MDSLPDVFGHVRDPGLRRMIGHWLGLRRGRLLPARRDVDPAALRWALADIFMVDHLPETDRYRFRLAGERIVEQMGDPMRGRHLDEIVPPGMLARVVGYYRQAIEGPALVHITGAINIARGRVGTGERILMTLADDGTRAGGLVGMTVYDWQNVHPAATMSTGAPLVGVTATPVAALASAPA